MPAAEEGGVAQGRDGERGQGGDALGDLAAPPEHAWLAPLPPEGASQLVHHDLDHADALARQQHISALDLHLGRTIHQLIPETDDDTAKSLAVAIAAEAAVQLHRGRTP